MKLEQIPQEYLDAAAARPELTLLRVTAQEKGRFRAASAGGEVEAVLSGRLQYEARTPADYPVVGDYVLADAAGGTTVIRAVLPRRSLFLRRAAGGTNTEQPVAANVDTVFLCMALNGDFSLRRLERYLSAAWDSGALPVVVLTKADLCTDLSEKTAQAAGAACGAEVLTTCALEADGWRCLAPYLTPGKTVAFLGSSGVGKSSLINRLLGAEHQAVNGLRQDGRGRHTTTRRELFSLPCGAAVLDTPGMRELGLWDAEEGMRRAFADMESLAARCRFRGCTHRSEPGCAVRAALDSGALDRERLRSYEKLAVENAYAADTERYLAAKEAKFRAIAKYNRATRKK